MAKGGYRPEAGRPKGQHTVEAEAAKARLVELFVAEKEEIFTALIRKAKKGDVPALKELFERVLGKPVQPIGNDGDNLLRIEWSQSQSPMPRGNGPSASTIQISAG
jgi:hypothetical protein